MVDLVEFRRNWSSDHKHLRKLLSSGNDLNPARELFNQLHAVLHSRSMANTLEWTYPDFLFSGLQESSFRIIPSGREHSLVWILWHISRIEDITMNVLVAGQEQIYTRGGWKSSLNAPVDHTGNLIGTPELERLNREVDLKQMHLYRDAVGQATRDIVSQLDKESLSELVYPDRLEELLEVGAVLPEASDLLAYWGKRKVYQLLLMPPTRHLMVHLNEASNLLKPLEKLAQD